MEANNEKLNIAVVGAGVAGITAACLLSKRHHVTLIERNDYVGGHTNTIDVDEDGVRVPVDTGFIVCNPKNYPIFYKLLAEWGVKLRDSDMSFGFSCDTTGLGYTGPSVSQFMRKPGNLLKPQFIGMIRQQRRFNRFALRDLRADALGDITLGDYLGRIRASDFFINNYLVPLSASVWSSPDAGILDFPAQTFLRFFDNHGLLELSKFPKWQTVVGGSKAYVEAFRAKFRGTILTNAAVRAIERSADGITIRLIDERTHSCDRVVLASHADETLQMLADPSHEERELLGTWQYHRNPTVLHTDTSVMPADKRLWASWNYRRPSDATPSDPVPITYSMNRLQGLKTQRQYFVTLNAQHDLSPGTEIYSVVYTHPAYTPEAVAAQPRIRAMNGTNHTYYCGSYLGYGFHEDAVRSAVDVAQHFGVSL